MLIIKAVKLDVAELDILFKIWVLEIIEAFPTEVIAQSNSIIVIEASESSAITNCEWIDVECVIQCMWA